MLFRFINKRQRDVFDEVEARTLDQWKNLLNTELDTTQRDDVDTARLRVKKISNIVFPYVL